MDTPDFLASGDTPDEGSSSSAVHDDNFPFFLPLIVSSLLLTVMLVYCVLISSILRKRRKRRKELQKRNTQLEAPTRRRQTTSFEQAGNERQGLFDGESRTRPRAHCTTRTLGSRSISDPSDPDPELSARPSFLDFSSEADKRLTSTPLSIVTPGGDLSSAALLGSRIRDELERRRSARDSPDQHHSERPRQSLFHRSMSGTPLLETNAARASPSNTCNHHLSEAHTFKQRVPLPSSCLKTTSIGTRGEDALARGDWCQDYEDLEMVVYN